MVDLLKEKWCIDGIATVFSEIIKTYEEGLEDGEPAHICDLSHSSLRGEMSVDDICAFASLIARALEMYRMLTAIAQGKEVPIEAIKALLAEIENA